MFKAFILRPMRFCFVSHIFLAIVKILFWKVVLEDAVASHSNPHKAPYTAELSYTLNFLN